MHTKAIWYSLLLLGYKPVQHVTVLNTAGNCNTMVLYYYNIILYYILMEPLNYMRSVIDRNLVIRRIPVLIFRSTFINEVVSFDIHLCLN